MQRPEDSPSLAEKAFEELVAAKDEDGGDPDRLLLSFEDGSPEDPKVSHTSCLPMCKADRASELVTVVPMVSVAVKLFLDIYYVRASSGITIACINHRTQDICIRRTICVRRRFAPPVPHDFRVGGIDHYSVPHWLLLRTTSMGPPF